MSIDAYIADEKIGTAICQLLSIKRVNATNVVAVARTCKGICFAESNDTSEVGPDREDLHIGMQLISALDLRVKGNGRVDTDGGDKTAIGLSRTVKRVIQEAS